MKSLLYFYPAPEGMYQKDAARRHWWQDAALLLQELPAKEREPFFLLVGCPVPAYYHGRRSWPPDVLSACMAEAVYGARGMADAWLHPDIMTLVSEEYRERWEPRRDTLERLLSCLISVYAADCIKRNGGATVFLGRATDTLWQIEMTGELLSPYLSRINRLTFWYEEADGADLWEEAEGYLEVYRYEYGLTPCLLPYGSKGGRKPIEKASDSQKMRDDRESGRGLLLDYGAPLDRLRFGDFNEAVYIDAGGSPLKERKCLAKGGRIRYVSPFKYLDTVVKNEYDRKD